MFWISIIILLFPHSNSQKNPHFVDNRSVIVHLNEWKWADIADECERFLQNKTYGGVQVSPPNENIVAPGRPWWERYQPVSYKIRSRSGSGEDFFHMADRCNEVGIRIYADVVLNHMAALSGTGTYGSKAFSDLKIYPAVPYNPEDFHTSCNITNYLNPEIVRNCQLNNLRDLDQSSEYVSGVIVSYLNGLIDIGVAGFRIDSAKYMKPEDLKAIYSKLKNLNTGFGFPAGSRAFIYQDVPVFEHDLVEAAEYTEIGAVIDYKYSDAINKVFRKVYNLTSVSNWGPAWGFVENSSESIVFVDNHSNQRKDAILTYKDLKLYKMAITFMLAHPYGSPRIVSSYFFYNKDSGPPMDSSENIKSPIIYSDGSCGNGYVCEHRWPQISNMVDFRNVVSGTSIENWWSDGSQQIAFSRGNKGFVAISTNGALIEDIQTSLPSGTYCDIISGTLINEKCSGKTVTINDNGIASISISEKDYDGVVAIHINSKLS